MIITRQKPMDEILDMLKGRERVFIVGCADCATSCQTGGEFEVSEMTERLAAEGKTVTGSVIPDSGCQELDVARAFRKAKDELAAADAVLVMSCGAGTQSAAAGGPGGRGGHDGRLPARDDLCGRRGLFGAGLWVTPPRATAVACCSGSRPTTERGTPWHGY